MHSYNVYETHTYKVYGKEIHTHSYMAYIKHKHIYIILKSFLKYMKNIHI